MPSKSLMAVGAHADDIELNVGGTLLKYRERGYGLVTVMATNNMAGSWHSVTADGKRMSERPPCDAMMDRRHREAEAGAAFLGATPVFLDHPQRHYRSPGGEEVELRYGSPRPACVPPDLPTILTAHEDPVSVRRLAEAIRSHDPEAVLTHGPIMQDLEHMATCLLVTKAFREAASAGYEGMLLLWLDISPTLFGPFFRDWETYVDISLYQQRKIQAIGLHASQMPTPSRLDFPPFGEACGCRYAETFTIGDEGRLQPESGAFRQEVILHKKRTGFSRPGADA